MAIPARTDGPESLIPLLEAPNSPSQAPAEAVVLVTTAEKVVALTLGTCRWPIGDPGVLIFTSVAVRRPRGNLIANPIAPWLAGTAA